MSSPPTPTTSIRAASLSNFRRTCQQRPSFPLVAVFNALLKKAPPKRAKSPSPVEPYEVAPGIWNTDATAKVFGYLESEEEKGKPRSKSVGSGAKKLGQIPKRKPVVQETPYETSKKAYARTRTDQAHESTNKTYSELSSEYYPDQTNGRKKSAIHVAKPNQDKMRTVSKDDQLVQRGANPRTGLVSPFIVSDSSEDNLIGHDFVKVGKIQWDSQTLPQSRTRSGKWKQQGAGWSLVESPTLSPIAQSINDTLSRKVSVKKLEDKLLVEMPGVDNPEPNNMTDDQVRRYQQSIGRAYKHGGETAMVDPDTLPSPRQSTSDGPSTPPNKLQRIRRKRVGSGPARKEESNDTIPVNSQERFSSAARPRKEQPPTVRNTGDSSIVKESTQVLASSMYTLGKADVKSPVLDNVIPSNAMMASASKTHPAKRTTPAGDHFLGPRKISLPTQNRESTQTQCLQPMPQQEAQKRLLQRSRNLPRASSVEIAPSLTLSQWLPPPQVPHPNRLAGLEISSHYHPGQLLPGRLHTPKQRMQTTEDACTTTITSTLDQKLEREQAPQLRRQDESMVITKVRQQIPQRYETSEENYLRVGTPEKKRSFDIKHMVDASGSSMIRRNPTRIPKQTVAAPGISKPGCRSRPLRNQRQNGRKTFSQEAERGAQVTVRNDHCKQQVDQGQLQKHTGSIANIQGLGLKSANIIPSLVGTDQKGGVGITHTYDHLGDLSLDGGSSNSNAKTRTMMVCCSENLGAPMISSRHGDVWFIGQQSDLPQCQNRSNHAFWASEENTTPEAFLLRETANTCQRSWAVKESLQASVVLRHAWQCLFHMACHVIRTFHPSSPAHIVLHSSNETQEYLYAVRGVIVAGIYLLFLLKMMCALRNALVLIRGLMFWVWHPVETLVGLLKRCVLA